MSSSLPTKVLLIAFAALALSSSAFAFQVANPRPLLKVNKLTPMSELTPLRAASMDDLDSNDDRRRINNPSSEEMQFLIDAKERRQREHERREAGCVQRIGKTVRNDGLDGVRSVAWALYGASTYIFPALGFAFFVQLTAQLAGYGFYFDEAQRSFVFDTLEHIRFVQATSLASSVMHVGEGVQNMM